jgi:hypothetical protein
MSANDEPKSERVEPPDLEDETIRRAQELTKNFSALPLDPKELEQAGIFLCGLAKQVLEETNDKKHAFMVDSPTKQTVRKPTIATLAEINDQTISEYVKFYPNLARRAKGYKYYLETDGYFDEGTIDMIEHSVKTKPHLAGYVKSYVFFSPRGVATFCSFPVSIQIDHPDLIMRDYLDRELHLSFNTLETPTTSGKIELTQRILSGMKKQPIKK